MVATKRGRTLEENLATTRTLPRLLTLGAMLTLVVAACGGGNSPAPSSAETLAAIVGTIPYEITCGINKRVPRVYVGDESRQG